MVMFEVSATFLLLAEPPLNYKVLVEWSGGGRGGVPLTIFLQSNYDYDVII